MADRKVYHVAPKDEQWEVKAEGAQRATKLTDTKKEALAAAKDLAKNQKPSQVVIHRTDGTIQTEHTYEDDPENIPG
jgi:uncharacterized protein YdaT